MIVVAVITLLAAIMIPNVLRARLNSNEAAVKGNLRAIGNAAESFRGSANPPLYPLNIAVMVMAVPAYLDSSWLNVNQRQGYTYVYLIGVAGRTTFSVGARPVTQNITGVNSYCIDQTGIIRRYPPGRNPQNIGGCPAFGGMPI